jgi:hypothetical protein
MEDLLQHWPFAATALILSVVGQAVKRVFFDDPTAKGWRLIGRKTLPMHPVVVGALLGFIPSMPISPGVVSWSGRILYFAFAGVCSTWAFNVLKQVLKKEGIVLDGNSTKPPPAPAEDVPAPDTDPGGKP